MLLILFAWGFSVVTIGCLRIDALSIVLLWYLICCLFCLWSCLLRLFNSVVLLRLFSCYELFAFDLCFVILFVADGLGFWFTVLDFLVLMVLLFVLGLLCLGWLLDIIGLLRMVVGCGFSVVLVGLGVLCFIWAFLLLVFDLCLFRWFWF